MGKLKTSKLKNEIAPYIISKCCKIVAHKHKIKKKKKGIKRNENANFYKELIPS